MINDTIHRVNDKNRGIKMKYMALISAIIGVILFLTILTHEGLSVAALGWLASCCWATVVCMNELE